MEIINVYDELYEAWLRDKKSADVQTLSKDFFSRLAQYVKKLKEESRMLDEKSTRARLLLLEAENAKRLSEDLIRLRYEKLLRKTTLEEPTAQEGLTSEEKKIYCEIASSAEDYQNFLKGVLSGNSSTFEADVEVKMKKRVLRFLREVPAIIGADMKLYGPFSPQDVASLPAENAKILVKQRLAVELQMNI
jgi:DNA replication initiation complex subunit (GINS family)